MANALCSPVTIQTAALITAAMIGFHRPRIRDDSLSPPFSSLSYFHQYRDKEMQGKCIAKPRFLCSIFIPSGPVPFLGKVDGYLAFRPVTAGRPLPPLESLLLLIRQNRSHQDLTWRDSARPWHIWQLQSADGKRLKRERSTAVQTFPR